MSWIVWVGTALGLGLSPVAPGTVGTLPGAAVAYGLSRWGLARQITATALLSILAVPVAGGASAALGGHDDGRIVVDELATFPVATLGLPCARHPALLAVAFVATRAFDVAKPGPVARAEAVDGGLGIVLDDAVASLMALPLGWLLYLGWYRRGDRGPSRERGAGANANRGGRSARASRNPGASRERGGRNARRSQDHGGGGSGGGGPGGRP